MSHLRSCELASESTTVLERERLKQGALAAWTRYQETGLHVTGGEADAWLAKLEAGEDAEAPGCHL
jgi:predicted transcriptional regulator